jgi:hypothetical protein
VCHVVAADDLRRVVGKPPRFHGEEPPLAVEVDAPWYDYQALVDATGSTTGRANLVVPVVDGPLEVRYLPRGDDDTVATSEPITVR